jgi:hypothetical protein
MCFRVKWWVIPTKQRHTLSLTFRLLMRNRVCGPFVWSVVNIFMLLNVWSCFSGSLCVYVLVFSLCVQWWSGLKMLSCLCVRDDTVRMLLHLPICVCFLPVFYSIVVLFIITMWYVLEERCWLTLFCRSHTHTHNVMSHKVEELYITLKVLNNI